MPMKQMSDLRALLNPDIEWLAAPDNSEFALDEWCNGPGPPIPHIYGWRDQLVRHGSRTAIQVASYATSASLSIWRDWADKDSENGMRPLGGPASPEEQITAVREWLLSNDDEAAAHACGLADLTIQTYWHGAEHEHIWFEEHPGVWTAESAQHCIEALHDARLGNDVSHSILIAILSAANAFRSSADDPWNSALESVLHAVRTGLLE